MTFYGGTVIERGQSPFSEPSMSSKLLKNILKYFVMPLTIVGGLTLCHQVNRNMQNTDTALCDEHLHNARVLIPQYESEHNYQDALALENKGWTFVRMAKKGEYRVGMEKIRELEYLLNTNNTCGDN